MNDIQNKIQQAIDLRAKKGDLQGSIKELELILENISGEDKLKVLIVLHQNYRDLGNTEKAYDLLDTTELENKNINSSAFSLIIQNLRGYLDLKTSKHKETDIISKLKKTASKISLDTTDTEELLALASAYALIGNCYAQLRLSKWNEAIQAYTRALDFALRSGNKQRVITVLGDIGNVQHFGYRNFEAAAGFFAWMRKEAEINNRHSLPAAILRLARVFNDSDNPNHDEVKAEELFTQSLDIARQEGWRREQGDALEALGNLHASQGKIEKAKKELSEAVAIFTAINHQEQLERIKSSLAKL